MKAISMHQPYPQLVVLGIKRFETRSWPFPPALISQPIAIHATQSLNHCQASEEPDGDWEIDGDIANGILAWQGPKAKPSAARFANPEVNGIPLPLSAIVGSGRITASHPIVSAGSGVTDKRIYAASGGMLALMHGGGDFAGEDWDEEWTDVSDQLPYGDFTPGRYAWQIEDAAPTTEPIPCKGHQRIWNVPDDIAERMRDERPDLFS